VVGLSDGQTARVTMAGCNGVVGASVVFDDRTSVADAVALSRGSASAAAHAA
jgi:hypothetical protein